MTRFFYDCEFIEDGRSIDLISIGIVADDPTEVREYYAVSSEVSSGRLHTNPWVVDHVVPHLPTVLLSVILATGECVERPDIDRSHWDVRPRSVIASEVLAFLTRDVHAQPELWAWCGAYDHVALMWLWGDMAAKPTGLPYYTRDLQQEIDRLTALLGREPDLPEQATGLHNPLADARHALATYRRLAELEQDTVR